MALQPLGWGRYSHEELQEQLGLKEGCALTHCFSVLVDEPASYKMLAQSKTFGKWKASYAPWPPVRSSHLLAQVDPFVPVSY